MSSWSDMAATPHSSLKSWFGVYAGARCYLWPRVGFACRCFVLHFLFQSWKGVRAGNRRLLATTHSTVTHSTARFINEPWPTGSRQGGTAGRNCKQRRHQKPKPKTKKKRSTRSILRALPPGTENSPPSDHNGNLLNTRWSLHRRPGNQRQGRQQQCMTTPVVVCFIPAARPANPHRHPAWLFPERDPPTATTMEKDTRSRVYLDEVAYSTPQRASKVFFIFCWVVDPNK